MLIAIISDTHMPRGERRLPDACVERLEGADLILHAGDVVGATAYAELELMGPPVLGVHGNIDDDELRRQLPAERIVEAGEAQIAMVHDAGPVAGRLDRMRARFPGAHAAVFGHSHIPVHETVDGFQIFNPGSPTDRRRAPDHTMGLARVAGESIEFELVVLG